MSNRVPDTNTFSLQDVVNVVLPPQNTLTSSFASANNDFFDPTYVGSKNSLYNFRNYGGETIILPIKYGYIYNSASVRTNKLAPTGWRLPRYAEILSLSGKTTNIGKNLKGKNRINSSSGFPFNIGLHPRWDESGNIQGLDTYNLSLYPGGYLHNGINSPPYVTDTRRLGEIIFYWTQSSIVNEDVWEGGSTDFLVYYYVVHDSDLLSVGNFPSALHGFYVRCVREATESEKLNPEGTVFSNIVTDIDGNDYDGILLNDLMWTKTNLAVSRLNDGTVINYRLISSIIDLGSWDFITPQYLIYDDNIYNAFYDVTQNLEHSFDGLSGFFILTINNQYYDPNKRTFVFNYKITDSFNNLIGGQTAEIYYAHQPINSINYSVLGTYWGNTTSSSIEPIEISGSVINYHIPIIYFYFKFNNNQI